MEAYAGFCSLVGIIMFVCALSGIFFGKATAPLFFCSIGLFAIVNMVEKNYGFIAFWFSLFAIVIIAYFREKIKSGKFPSHSLAQARYYFYYFGILR